jgi:mannose-6-phosphate isomerase-like protein (cupin superfamily)
MVKRSMAATTRRPKMIRQRSDEKPDGLFVVAPGQGQPLFTNALIARSAWTRGAYFIIDQIVSAHTLTPAHAHEIETQGAYVVSGVIGFYVDGEETEATAGSYVVRPSGSVHSLWNPTDEPAHMLEITTPGERFQRYLLAVHELSASGQADPASVAALAAEHGTFFHEEVTADLCRRHGLTPRRSAFAVRQ